MTKPIQIKVPVSGFFSNEAVAGLPYEEWKKMKSQKLLVKRLEFIEAECIRLINHPFDEKNKLSANTRSAARTLAKNARSALQSLEKGDYFSAMHYAIETGKLLEKIKLSIPALTKAMDYEIAKITRQKNANASRVKQKQDQSLANETRAVELFLSEKYQNAPPRYRSAMIAKEMEMTPTRIRTFLQNRGFLERKKRNEI